jgi:hypothetical protein
MQGNKFEHKTGRGNMFRNKKKENDNHPDWRGEINIDGKLMEISAWEKQGKGGLFYSLAMKEKREFRREPDTREEW